MTTSRVRSRAVQLLAVMCCAVNVAWGQSPTLRIVVPRMRSWRRFDESQRSRAVFAFDDDKQRVRWSNFATSFVPRAEYWQSTTSTTISDPD